MMPSTPKDPRSGQQPMGGQPPGSQTITPPPPESPMHIAQRLEQQREKARVREREAATATSGGTIITTTATTATSPKWWELYPTPQEKVKL